MRELVTPDWLTALMPGKLQAVAAAAADLGRWLFFQDWGWADRLLEGSCLSHPSELSQLHPVYI